MLQVRPLVQHYIGGMGMRDLPVHVSGPLNIKFKHCMKGKLIIYDWIMLQRQE